MSNLEIMLAKKIKEIKIGKAGSKKQCQFCNIVEKDPYGQLLFKNETVSIFEDKYKKPSIQEHLLGLEDKCQFLTKHFNSYFLENAINFLNFAEFSKKKRI